MWFLFQVAVITPMIMNRWYLVACISFLMLDMWKSWFDKHLAEQKKIYEAEKAKQEKEEKELEARAKRRTGEITRAKPVDPRRSGEITRAKPTKLND